MTNPRPPFEIQVDLQAPRDAVWRALTDAREIARWFAPTVRCDARIGGRMTWQWGELHTWDQTIEALTPGAHLRTRYDSQVDDGRGGRRPLFVDVHLEGSGGTTTLRLVHSGFGPEADFAAEYDGIRSGWPVELRSLRLYLERHRGSDRMLAWSARSTALAPAAAWARLTGPDGLAAPDLAQRREGDPFTIHVPGIGPLAGTTLFVPGPREFSGLVPELGDAWLRLHAEHWNGATQVWLWLAVYDGPRARVDALQRAFDAVATRLLGAPVQTGSSA